MTAERVALVTGGASGIGRAICARLREDGLQVAAVDLKPDAAAEVAMFARGCDVTDESDVDSAVAAVLDRFGAIDVLVNNAGITGSQAATTCHETPVEEWDRVHTVNVRGPFLASRAVLPSMVARGSGHVINIASIAGLVAFPGRCAYTASKGAALMLAKSIAVDYAAAGIRANAVCPGMVYTPMTSWRLDQPALRTQVEDRIPVGRVATPDEIADAVSVLASGRMSYVTGHALVIDGGMTAL
ncbi:MULTISPECIES: SDR family NAD(P)-dependent oxidoreductase [Amycolatopsis]|uniref:NAD(P)-dependent dehydrogenase (Short-subunit alcohol dehydrogenase family) n=2 Tax=Amycolatopsis TaxID=1813 RepID=A0A2N3X117_9PSEU|nr:MULTISPECIES: SDR family oxidoreductase [Amycolatopsis]MBB2505436.1 SDR family oxidoreductase [Amycolatopsis echigonensis]PKV99813.1 NAD(P)-dependent dehydrogenase (short-subunit alcohol dehydrogenase family) [Amycolatopsis niigatensis]WIV60803.1 SDR family oxidoreductase [Amycolatopsis sp. 2-2]